MKQSSTKDFNKGSNLKRVAKWYKNEYASQYSGVMSNIRQNLAQGQIYEAFERFKNGIYFDLMSRYDHGTHNQIGYLLKENYYDHGEDAIRKLFNAIIGVSVVGVPKAELLERRQLKQVTIKEIIKQRQAKRRRITVDMATGQVHKRDKFGRFAKLPKKYKKKVKK